MGKGKARTRMYGANKNASTSPTKEAGHTGAKFYEYYDMLSLPMPHAPFCAPDPHRRPDTDPNEHLYSPQAVKKGYRRASLIHHPDRGGDPDVFIKLKRAAKVLGDKGLRQRYDYLGLDTGRDDGSTSERDKSSKDDKDEADDPSESDGTSTSIIFTLNQTLSTYFINTTLKTALLLVCLSLAQVRLIGRCIVGAEILGIGYFMHKTKFLASSTNLSMSATARKYALIGLFSIPFLTVIFLWSGSGGWLFFCFETSLLFLAVGGPALEDGCPVAFMGLFGFLSAVACWWLQGRFWRYCFLLVFEVGLGIFFFLACQGCDYLVNMTVTDILHLYSSKLVEAITYDRSIRSEEIENLKKELEEKDRLMKLFRSKCEAYQRTNKDSKDEVFVFGSENK